MSIEAMKQALEALKGYRRETNEAAITALRAAIAEATGSKMETVKPVAWNEYPIDTDTTRGPMLMTVGDTLARAGFVKKQKPLTDEEVKRIKPVLVEFVSFRSGVRCAERAHGIGGEK